MAQRGASAYHERQGSFLFRLTLVAVDLTAIALPAWYFINSVSFAYTLVIAVMQVFIFRENSLYWRHSALYKAYWPQFTALLRSYIPIFIIFCVISFISQAFGSRPRPGDLLLLFAIIVGLNIGLRFTLTSLIALTSFGRAPGWLVIGASPRARLIADEIKNEPRKMRFLGFVVDRKDGSDAEITNEEVVGSLDGLEDAITITGASNAVVVADDKPIEEVFEIVDRVTGRRLRLQRSVRYCASALQEPADRQLHGNIHRGRRAFGTRSRTLTCYGFSRGKFFSYSVFPNFSGHCACHQIKQPGPCLLSQRPRVQSSWR